MIRQRSDSRNDCMSSFPTLSLLDTLTDDDMMDLLADGGIFAEDCCTSPTVDEPWDWDQLLPTPPWSPCAAEVFDEHEEPCCGSSCSASTSDVIGHRRCESFHCACVACEGGCSMLPGGPVLKDCMWSATTGLIPLRPVHGSEAAVSVDQTPATDASGQVDDVKDSVCHKSARVSDCIDIAKCCVDPKSVFPYPVVAERTVVESAASSPAPDTPSSIVEDSSAVYDPESETSACCSSFEDDDVEEIDVVSVMSSSPSPVARSSHLLILPASESMSAQVAAMHNYSTTRCRPMPSTRVSHSVPRVPLSKCARPTRAALKRKRPRRNQTPVSSSESSSDSGVHEERCRRAQHNVMERQRRHHLKGNFYGLRDVIPSISGDEKISKVAILRAGADYIRQLNATHEALMAEYNRLRGVQEGWKWKQSVRRREMRLSVTA